jgi:hypothetical protein
MSITDDASNSPSNVVLYGAGTTGGPTYVNPASLTFSSLLIGNTSASKSVTFTNSQPAASITIGTVTATGDFTVGGGNTCSGTLLALANCTIPITFKPSAAGSRSGTLSITDSADANPVVVSLSGTGLPPASLTPASLGFTPIIVGTTPSPTGYATVTNNQASALTISQITLTGSGSSSFAYDASACGTLPSITVPANGGTCKIKITFAPTTAGYPAATLSVTESADANPLTINVFGTARNATTVTPSSLSFGNVSVGLTSAINIVTLTNNQAVALNISSIAVTAGSGYAIDPSSTCANPGTLAAATSCTIALAFSPTAVGASPATLTITHNAITSPQTVALSGTGVSPVALTPSNLAFGTVTVVGSSSSALPAVLKNNQSAPLNITSAIFGGPYTLDTTAHSITTCPVSGGMVTGTLAAGSSCVIGVIFTPTGAGSTGGQLTVNDSATNSPQVITITGLGAFATTLSPSSYNFNNVVLNATSVASNFTFTNNQTVAVNFTSIAVPAPYAIAPATTTCVVGTPLASKSSCIISVTLTPTTLGAQPASVLTVKDDAATSPQTVSLSGYGITPVALSSNTLNFGSVVVNVPVIKNLTLTNYQSTPLTISSITGFPGGYTLDSSTTCPISPATLAAGAKCTIAVNLNATATGADNGTISINDDAPGSPQTFSVLATATMPVHVSPNLWTFTPQFEGASSTPLTITITNLQTAPPVALNIASISASGTNPGDFVISNSCPLVPASLAPGTHCTFTVVFAPTGAGLRSATINIADDAPGSPQTVTLSGSGKAPVTFAPSALKSFSAPVGTTSAYSTVTITNSNSAQPLTINNFQFIGDFQQTATTCPFSPSTLAGGASCTVSVTFAPTIGGVRGGQLQIYDNAFTSPQAVNLQGTGTAPLTITPTLLSFSALKVGSTSAPKNLTLTNHESQAETFTLTPTGDFTASSNCTGGVIAAQSSCIISVNFVPTATGARNGSLSIAHTAAIGSPLNISLVGSGTATNPPAAVAVVSPGAGTAGTTVPVTITGNGWTNFSSSSVVLFDKPSASIPAGITANTVVANSANQLTANLVIDPAAIAGARNIRVVTPLTGGGSETALLSSAFIIATASNSHTITAVSPNFGTQGQTLNVDLTGSGTNFVQGVTYANFGDGITVNYVKVNSLTDAVATITISNTSYVGYRTITLVTGGEVATSGPQAFLIVRNNSALLSVSPTSAAQGANVQVTLTASGTHFLQNATTASFGSGINVGNIQVTGLTSAIAQLAVSPSATVGLHDVTVSTGGEIETLPSAFSVSGATPYLNSVTPSSAQQGQTLNVEIIGTFTNFDPANILADFGGDITVNSYNVKSATDVVVNITVSTGAAVTSRTARLTTGPSGSQTIFPFTFTVTPSSASIISVSPSSVPQGGQVTLTVVGSNTHWIQGTTTAAFSIIPVGSIAVNLINIIDATHATLNISVSTDHPIGPHSFYMATGGEVVYASVSVYAQTPTLTMSPANGLPGATMSVTFTGQFTHFSSTTLPVVSGQGVTLQNFTVNSVVGATAKLVIDPAALPGLRTITFTTGGEIVTTQFSVTNNSASLIYISPYQSPQNNTLNVEITGSNSHFTSSGATPTQVLFDPFITVNSVTVNSPTDLIANITVGSYNGTLAWVGYHTAYVNTGTEQLIIGFGVTGPASPSLVSVVPSSGAQGSTEDVVITGSLTNFIPGTTEAILGAGVTVANFTVTSPTTATATISVSPTAPIGGNSVILITGPQIISGAGFSVTPGSSEIQSVLPVCSLKAACGTLPPGPWQVTQLQTTDLVITGVGTNWLQGETKANFGSGVAIDSLTINSPTSATVKITVLSTSPVGFAPLTMTTDGEIETLQQAIDVEQGFPTLLSTTPAGGEQGATLTLQLLGRFTSWQQGVTTAAFNQDITVNSVTVLDSSSATASITVSPLAYVDTSCSPSGHTITITTGTEQVSLPGTFCVGQGAAQINSVSPGSGYQGSTESVSITGSATHFTPGVTQVSFNDSGISVGTIVVNSATSLTVPVAVSTSAFTGFHSVTATTLGEVATQQFAFQVSPGVATLNEAIPNQGEQGAPLSSQPPLVIRLLGQYSHFSAQSTATFGAGIVVQSVAYVSPTEVDATITIDPLSYPGGRTVTVTTPNVSCAYQPPVATTAVTYAGCTPGSSAGTGSEIVTANIFSVIPGPAIISSVTLQGGGAATGNQGQEVVINITGANTHWAQNFTQFYIPGAGSDITVNAVIINSPTSATVDFTIAPTAGPGARSIYMVTAGEALTDSGAFVVTGGIPVITYLSPSSAQPGTTALDVTIHGLYTQWDSTTTVNFGPDITVDTFQVEDNFTINAVIDIASAAKLGYRTVFVQTGTQGLTSNFLVQPPPPPPVPFIWYETPSSGLPGQTFTITFLGSNTHWDPNPTSGTMLTGFAPGVTINTFQVTSPTTALANITIDPAATASSSLLTLTTGSEVDTANFNVVIAVPTLSIVDPGSGMQGAQNITVNIIGQYTTFDTSTTFNFGQGITVNGPPTILGPTIASQSISIAQLAQLGGRSVIATTPDLSTPQVVGGAGFSVTPSLALISAITPNTAKQGQSITVDVTGQNTHWSGATKFQFGAGIVVSSTTVNSATDATLVLSLPALAPLGPTGASATTLGEVASITNGFVVQAGTPLLLSSGPGSAPQQGSVRFTILSQATQWTTSAPTVSYGPGVVLTNTTVTGDTSLTVDGFIQPTTSVGPRTLTVSTGSQILTLPNAFYVSAGPAVINSVTPSSGGQGSTYTVSIAGINTNWQQGVTQLNFPQVQVNSFTVLSPTTATANITVSPYATPGLVSISMTTLGEVAAETNAFQVIQTEPQMLFINASSAVQGQTATVTVTAVNTHFVNGTTTASFGTGVIVNSVTVTSSTTLQANVTVQPTATLGYRNVSCTTGTEVVASTNLFQVARGPAAIISLSPSSGGEGNSSLSVLVTGSQTNFASGVTTAAFGGGISVIGISVIDALHANVTISIPNSTPIGAYNVSLITGGEVATILSGFNVNAGNAQLSTVSPPTGHQGDTNLSVNLTGLFTNFVNGTSTVTFGAGITINSLTVSDSTHAVASINISSTAALGSRTVTVTTGGEVASIIGGFTVLAGQPALVSAIPGSAVAGATANVVIDGAFTHFQQGVSTASFGAGVTVNTVTVSNSTQLTANISVSANTSVGSRDITVTTGSEVVTLSSGFSVLPGTAVVTQINPNIGVPNSTVTVTIYGQFTNWVNGTTVASFGPGITVGTGVEGAAGQVVVNSPTSLTASLTIDPSAALGPRDVIVTTGAEVEDIPAGFTVQPTSVSPPSLVSLSPGANAGGMPINSNIIAVFSQPMSRSSINTTDVLLYLISNPNQGYVPVSGNITLDATGRVLTFAPLSQLAVNSQYYLELTNAIQDASGNAFGYYQASLYTTFAANTTQPVVTTTNPPNGATGVGTNVTIQLQFSADMDQATQAGVTVSDGVNNVAGSYSWNSNPNCCSWGPGTILYFTPASPLIANHTYTVSFGAPLVDTAGNAVTAGSFTFSTGGGPDTAQNYTGLDFSNGQGNVGTNFAPKVTFSKPINPLDVNTGTLLLYNADSGKYINGSVTLAPNGLGATFTPVMPLLPDTYYRIHMSWGNYDMDGNYLFGVDGYFTTGPSAQTTPPQVAEVFPANSATGVPLNAQITVHFNEPIDPATYNAIQVTPSGGSPIAGTNSLSSDQVTLVFTPAVSLQGSTNYTVQVSGFQDLAGNVGTSFTSTFTTATSITPVILSTGFDGSGHLITVNNTNDANWVVVPNGSSTAQPLQVVGPGDVGWYSGWVPNGPSSDWVTLNPNSVTGNTNGTYSTTFNLSGSLNNLCLVGYMGVDDNGTLLINGNAITSQISAIYTLAPLSVSIPSAYLNSGANTLTLQWGPTDNSYEAFRLQASIQTCGASFTGGLSVTGSNPANNSTNVPTNSTITLTFSYPLDPATVNSNTLPVMVGWNSNYILAGNYLVSGNQVTFTPDSPFPTNTTIWVGACNGPFDTAGDSAGNCYTQLISFTTGTTATPPSAPFQVTAFSPAANATSVGLRAPVVATFNRSFNPNTVNPNNASSGFALYDGDGNGQNPPSSSPWCTSYSRSQDNSTLQFNCGVMPSSSSMTALLNSNIQDMSGNPLTNFTSQFTTSQYDSNTNASVVTVRPGNGSGGVGVNSPIVFFTNLPVDPSTASSAVQVAQNNIAITGSVQVLDNGYTVQFTPSSPFTAGALIQWWVNSSLTNTTYGTNFNAASGYFLVAADTSTLTPTVQVLSPSYGATIPPNAIFDVQFNTPLDATTVNPSNIYLYDSGTGLHVTATYSTPQPNTVRIVPGSDLSTSAYIYLYVNTGLHSSTSVPAVNNSWYFYSNGTDDTTLPVVISSVPYNGATGVGVNVTPGVVFSKAIDPVSVNNTTFKVLSGATPLAGNYWISTDNTRVNFVPNAPLPANTILTMSVNGVLDGVGHPVTFTSNFTTGAGPDFVQPTVVWTSVSSNESIPTNSSITVRFSESMDVTTFSTNNLYIYDTLLGTRVAATLSWSADQSVAYLLPAVQLSAGRQYYLNVTGGTDLAGNALQGVFLYFYATFSSSTAAPTVVSFSPLNGATGVGVNVVIQAQFTAPIDPTTLSGVTLSAGGTPVPATPSLSAGNAVLQLVPATPLAANTSYQFTIAGVKDPAGNAVSTVSSTFTTGPTYDIGAPYVVSYDPPNYATVGTNVVPKLVFSKPLNPITVSNNTFRMYLNDTGQWIPLTVTQSSNGMTVTLQPEIPLLPNTLYHYQACCGYQDQNGNNGNQADLYFLTNGGTDTTGPTVSISPVSGATGVPLHAHVVVQASKPLDPTSWNQSSIQVLDNLSHPVPGTVSQADTQTLTFVPTGTAVAAGTSVGCWSGQALNGYSFSSNTMSVEYCVSTCAGQGYAYAGVAYGSNCYCGGDTYWQNGQSASCTTTCNGNALETCGGGNAENVYAASSQAATNLFLPNITYTVNVSGFTDADGNAVVPATSQFTTGTTTGSGGLTLTSTNIPNGSTNVSNTQAIQLTFSQILNPETVNTGTLLVMNSWNSNLGIAGTYSVDGAKVTFTPSSPYPAGATIWVGSCNGPTDVLGDVFSGCYQQLLSFTVTTATPDTTPLQVISVNPASGATGVRPDVPVSVTFNKSITPYSVYYNSNNALLFSGQGLQDRGSITMSADNRTMTFNTGTLYTGTAYTIDLPAGGITDQSGNALASTFTSTFTTGYNPATGNGSVSRVNPGFNATGVPTNTLLTLYLNRMVNPATLAGNVIVTVNGQVYAGSVQATASGYEVQFTPTVAFPYGAVVQWWFSGVSDTDGNAFNANNGVFYTQAAVNLATAQPQIVAVSPGIGSVNMPTNGQFDLEYNVPIDPTTLGGVFLNSGPSTPFTIALVPGSPNVVRITPNTPWDPSTFYGFCVNTSLKGTNGVAAPYTCWAEYATTTSGPDSTSGTVTLGPPDGSTNVGTNAYIRLGFSKPVDVTSINSTSVQVTTGGNPIPGTWSFNYVGSDVIGANFSPVNPLPPSSTILVSVSGLLDYAGNSFSTATAQFTTAALPDFTAATVSFPFPSGTPGIGTNATFTCRYSKPMDPSSITPTGTYVWSYATNARVPVTYSIAGDMMSATMTPTAPLAANSQFYYACNSAIDLTGNGQNNGNVGFYTGSGPATAGTTLLQTNPPNGFSNVALNTNNGPWCATSVGLLFSGPVAENSLGNITLTPNGGSPLAVGFCQEIGDTAVMVALPSSLQPNTTYTFNVTGVTDYAGNPIAPVTSSFTTGSGFDWNAPSVASFSPVSGATGVSTTVTPTITFSEAMNPVLMDSNHVLLRDYNTQAVIPTTFTFSPDYTTITLTPTAPLASTTIYEIEMQIVNWWITDIAGNNINTGQVTSNFTTGP